MVPAVPFAANFFERWRVPVPLRGVTLPGFRRRLTSGQTRLHRGDSARERGDARQHQADAGPDDGAGRACRDRPCLALRRWGPLCGQGDRGRTPRRRSRHLHRWARDAGGLRRGARRTLARVDTRGDGGTAERPLARGDRTAAGRHYRLPHRSLARRFRRHRARHAEESGGRQSPSRSRSRKAAR